MAIPVNPPIMDFELEPVEAFEVIYATPSMVLAINGGVPYLSNPQQAAALSLKLTNVTAGMAL